VCVCVVSSYDRLLAWKSRWLEDGINSEKSLGSKVVSRTDHKLYTNVTVDVGQPPVDRPDVSDHINHQSLFWSVLLYFWFLPCCAMHKRSLCRHAVSVRPSGFGDRHGMPPPASNSNCWPFDLETDMRVASTVGNLPSKFGHAKPLGSRIIRCACDRRTDGQMQRLLSPSPVSLFLYYAAASKCIFRIFHCRVATSFYIVVHKKTLINVDQFLKFCHWQCRCSKFATRSMSYFPPHLQCIATLHCGKHNMNSSKILMNLIQYHRCALLFTKLAK